MSPTPAPTSFLASTLGPEQWNRRSLRLLQLLAPVLILTGTAGFLLPPSVALMSGAAPYNLFHIGAGLLGIGVAMARRPLAVGVFNLLFGLIDLYQAAAGVTGRFPARWFALRPADHLVHLALGALLVASAMVTLRANLPSPERRS